MKKLAIALFLCGLLATTALGDLFDGPGSPVMGLHRTVAQLKALLGLPLSVTEPACGATGNNSGDDSLGVNNCIAILNYVGGGTLYFPCGTYNVTGSGSSIFTAITVPIRITSAGMTCTTILLNAAVPNTRDVFHFTSATLQYGYLIENLTVGNSASALGRHVFNFDSTGGSAASFSDVIIQRVFLNKTAAGNGVWFNNTGSINANGGVFQASVRDSVIISNTSFNSIACTLCGDSINIKNNVLSGAGGAILVDQIAGAGQFIVENNNISAAGMIQVVQASGPIISHNEIEQQATNVEANNAMIDFSGTILAAKVVGNSLNALSGTGSPTLIAMGASVTGGVIAENVLTTATNYPAITIASGATSINIAPSNYFNGSSPGITNNSPISGLIMSPIVGGYANGVNFNSVADTAITINCPTTNYVIIAIYILNESTTASLTSAKFGLFTAASGGGNALVASGTVMSGLTQNVANINGGMIAYSPAAFINLSTLYFRITTAQGATAAGSVVILIQPMP